MKVCIYFEGIDNIKTSGIGRAYRHQVEMCQQMGIDYTTDYKDTYDILHINTIFMKSGRAIHYAKKQNAKIIYHAHSTKEDFENSFRLSNLVAPLFKQWLIHLYSMADLIITPTAYSKSLIEGYGISKPTYALSNGIDIAQYAPNKDKEALFRDYFQLTEDEKVFISVGFWFKRKGILDLIETARQLSQYKFIWFGKINENAIPKEIRQALKHAPDNCIFPGYIDGDIIKGAFSGATGFVFMSYEETEGIVVLEALASKQAVIIRDIPVYSDWLEDGVNVFKAHSIDEFKERINYLANNDTTNLRQAGYQVALSKDIPNISKELQQIYQAALEMDKEDTQESAYLS